MLLVLVWRHSLHEAFEEFICYRDELGWLVMAHVEGFCCSDIRHHV